jgi:hypothetical protein
MEEARCGAVSPGGCIVSAHSSRRLLGLHLQTCSLFALFTNSLQTFGGWNLRSDLLMPSFRPSSTNGTIYNDKKIKQLAEPIEIRALEEMESLSMRKYLLFVSAQDACRAKRTLERILIVVFGSVSTRGPTSNTFRMVISCSTAWNGTNGRIVSMVQRHQKRH